MLTRATLNLPVCARCAVHVLVRVLVLVLYVNVKVHKCVHVRVSQPVDWWDGQRGQRRGAQLDGEFALAADFGWRGAQLDREFAFYASRRRLRTWLDCGGGACSWTGNFHCMLLAADFGAGPEGAAGRCSAFAWSSLFYLSLTGLCYAHSLVPRLPTPSKTVDQTLLPRWDGQRRRLYCVS